MQVKILSEAGYNEALFGLGLSHGVTSNLYFEWYNDLPYWLRKDGIDDSEESEDLGLKMENVAQRLAGKGMGHDKFLRQICVWLDITAPRYWWPEMDQYKVATVTQSESTMHTITKKEFTVKDFRFGYEKAYLQKVVDMLNELRNIYIDTKDKAIWKMIIQLLPQSYLQRRILTCNYETLRNIIKQRTGHKLSEWAIFIDAIKSQAQHPELLNV